MVESISRESDEIRLSPSQQREESPLVFGTNGGMGIECQMFLKQLAQKLAEKDNERYAVVIAWLRTRISFEILRSVHVSVRGSRSPFYRKELEVVDDFGLNAKAAEVLQFF